LRRLRIAAPVQLTLDISDLNRSGPECWWSLPSDAQETVIGILARMIASSVVDIEEEDGDDPHR
jgi:hypothetical protein